MSTRHLDRYGYALIAITMICITSAVLYVPDGVATRLTFLIAGMGLGFCAAFVMRAIVGRNGR